MKILSTFTVLAACAENILARGIVKRETPLEECKFINTLLGQDETFDCCQVDGVECSVDGHIQNIINPEITIRDLPDSIGTMPYVENIDLSGLELKGNIPQDIGTLKRLKFLRLNDNYIEGTIPDSVGNLTTLEHLVLNANDLEGTIPSTISGCSKLTELHLQSNRLSGEIPTVELEKLKNLVVFDLSDNENIYGRAPNNKDLVACFYHTTELCYSESAKNENCEYPETYYDCAVCADDKISTLTDGYCSCNEGYTGPAYIGCTAVPGVNNNNANTTTDNNSSNANNTSSDNSNANNNSTDSNNNNVGNVNNAINNSNKNNDSNSNDNTSGTLSNLSSMKLLHLALAVFTIGMLYI